MFAALHNRERRAHFLSKVLHRFEVSQIVIRAVQNMRRDVPMDGMLPHVAKVFPRKSLAECGRDFAFFTEFIFGDIRPLHHVANELFQVDHRRNEVSVLDSLTAERVHREERPDAISNQVDFVIARGN